MRLFSVLKLPPQFIIIKQSGKKVLVFIGITFAVIQLAYLLSIKPLIAFDNVYFLELADKFTLATLVNYYDETKPYLYPLFLAVTKRLHSYSLLRSSISYYDLVTIIQYLLHVTTSILSYFIVRQLSPTSKRRWAVFAMLFNMLNPLLWGLSRDFLADNISPFLLNLSLLLLVFALKKNHIRTYWLISLSGLAAGLLVVTKVALFNVFLVLIAASVLYLLAMRRMSKHITFCCLLYAIFFTLPLIPQYIGVWKNEHTLKIMPAEYYDIHVESHMISSNYIWKYETHAGNTMNTDHIFYVNRDYLKSFAICGSEKGLLKQFICKGRFPVKTLTSVLIKSVGLFVHHSLSTFRYNTNNSLTIVSAFGFLLLYMAISTAYSSIYNHRLVVMVVFILLNILLFSTITYPETRFINHIMPLIPISYAVKSCHSSRLLTQIVLFISTIAAYFCTYTYFNSIQVFTY